MKTFYQIIFGLAMGAVFMTAVDLYREAHRPEMMSIENARIGICESDLGLMDAAGWANVRARLELNRISYTADPCDGYIAYTWHEGNAMVTMRVPKEAAP